MRPLFCSAHLLLALGMTLQGCNQSRQARTPPATLVAQAAGPQIGQPAPDIAGEDQNGVPFKLSDYRGKVVVLDFWGNW